MQATVEVTPVLETLYQQLMVLEEHIQHNITRLERILALQEGKIVEIRNQKTDSSHDEDISINEANKELQKLFVELNALSHFTIYSRNVCECEALDGSRTAAMERMLDFKDLLLCTMRLDEIMKQRQANIRKLNQCVKYYMGQKE